MNGPQAKLLVILQENVIDSTALIDLVRSAKSAMSKLQMMKEILRSDTENLEVRIIVFQNVYLMTL